MRVLIFIGLKIFELAGLVGFFFLTVTIGKVIAVLLKMPENNYGEIDSWKPWRNIFWGLIGLLFWLIGGTIVYTLYEATKANWQWATQIVGG